MGLAPRGMRTYAACGLLATRRRSRLVMITSQMLAICSSDIGSSAATADRMQARSASESTGPTARGRRRPWPARAWPLVGVVVVASGGAVPPSPAPPPLSELPPRFPYRRRSSALLSRRPRQRLPFLPSPPCISAVGSPMPLQRATRCHLPVARSDAGFLCLAAASCSRHRVRCEIARRILCSTGGTPGEPGRASSNRYRLAPSSGSGLLTVVVGVGGGAGEDGADPGAGVGPVVGEGLAGPWRETRTRRPAKPRVPRWWTLPLQWPGTRPAFGACRAGRRRAASWRTSASTAGGQFGVEPVEVRPLRVGAWAWRASAMSLVTYLVM